MRTTYSTIQKCYEYSKLPARFIEPEHPSEIEVGSGLYLFGRPGTGKTWAAVTAAKRLIDSTYSLVEATGAYRVASVKFTTSNGLLSEYRSTYSDGTEQTEDAVTGKLAKCDLLVIDDLGKEPATEWAVSKLFDVVNARYESMLPIIVTSQYDKKRLAERISRNGDVESAHAIVSRLCEMCRTIDFGDKDRRVCANL